MCSAARRQSCFRAFRSRLILYCLSVGILAQAIWTEAPVSPTLQGTSSMSICMVPELVDWTAPPGLALQISVAQVNLSLHATCEICQAEQPSPAKEEADAGAEPTQAESTTRETKDLYNLLQGV